MPSRPSADSRVARPSTQQQRQQVLGVGRHVRGEFRRQQRHLVVLAEQRVGALVDGQEAVHLGAPRQEEHGADADARGHRQQAVADQRLDLSPPTNSRSASLLFSVRERACGEQACKQAGNVRRQARASAASTSVAPAAQASRKAQPASSRPIQRTASPGRTINAPSPRHAMSGSSSAARRFLAVARPDRVRRQGRTRPSARPHADADAARRVVPGQAPARASARIGSSSRATWLSVQNRSSRATAGR